MTSHELARLLLTLPDLPVATEAMNHTYITKAHGGSHGELKVGLLHSYAGDHVVIGNMSRMNTNRPNSYVKRMYHGRAPRNWWHPGGPDEPLLGPEDGESNP